jgi:hypothetical protein
MEFASDFKDKTIYLINTEWSMVCYSVSGNRNFRVNIWAPLRTVNSELKLKNGKWVIKVGVTKYI